MIYSVKARFHKTKMPEFYQKLTDGTIEHQKPDGKEIIDSMKRAKITSNNEIMWSETCYCSPPLQHERQTVYDKYLSDIKTEPIEEYTEYNGIPFMEYLEKLSRT